MTVLLTITIVITQYLYTSEDGTDDRSEKGSEDEKSKVALKKQFDVFRRKYILVYLVIMLADWMQGTHMYTLYLSYNVNVSALFITGFLSGAIFAPFLGSFVDKFGRKNSCIMYCILEIIINTLEHSHDFGILLFGRVLGGISTNLLFSAFESWMTTQHRKQGFPEEWMSKTYSDQSIGNGTMAILAGIVAQVLEDNIGHIGPFQGAIALTALALLLVLPWEENYGEKDSDDEHSGSLYQQFIEGWGATLSNSHIWRIGMTQALSEGGMYTFVFMWVPTLLSMNPPGGLPTGCVFAAMMMAITIGGMAYPPLQSAMSHFSPKGKAPELCATFVYLVAAASTAVPAVVLSESSMVAGGFTLVIAAFMVTEATVGLFMPVAGTLRSKYVPDALQGAILNIFRLPLNAVVVAGTHATDVLDANVCFQLVSGLFFTAALLQGSFLMGGSSTSAVASSKKKD
jgi:MFS family permease